MRTSAILPRVGALCLIGVLLAGCSTSRATINSPGTGEARQSQATSRPPSHTSQTVRTAQAAYGAPGSQNPGKRWVVCIDPGHPSETSAGANAGGLSENRLNWQVALQLNNLLQQTPNIQPIMTKSSEHQYVTNRHRAETANSHGAVLFIRLHCDVGSGHGFTWYYPDRSGRKAGVVGPPVEIQRESREAATILNEAMKPILRGYLRSNPIRTDADTFVGSHQSGVLTGSIFSRVPTALIEMCFINQTADARFIASPEGQEKMAQALAAGIREYVARKAAGGRVGE